MSGTRVAPHSVRYRERLWVPWWWWPLAFAVAALFAFEINLGVRALPDWLPYATLFTAADLDEMADRFLSVEAEVALTHDEHATITLPPGQYRVRRQREFAPEAPVYVTD